MDPATMMALGLLIQGGSSIYGAYQENKQGNQADAYRRGMSNRAEGFIQNSPYGYERQINELLGAGPSEYETGFQDWLTAGVPTSQAYNTGQDALTQMLRAEPYDLTSYFNALNPIEQRLVDQQVSGLRGNATGLGQRFGSALLGAETDLRQNAASEQQARREGLGFQAYESAMGRRAGAGQALASLGIGRDQLVSNTMLGGYGQLFGAEQGRRGFQTSLLQLLAQAAQGRQSNNANILALMQGIQPGVTQDPWAAAGGEMGQLMMLWPMLQQMMNMNNTPAPAS